MPLQEQKNRMALMQQRLIDYDVVKWVNDFLEQLDNVKKEQQKQKVKLLDNKMIGRIHQHYQSANNRCLLLDYDGTLVPFSRLPVEAVPGKSLIDLLSRLSDDPKNNVVIISGREASVLQEWFGSLPISLVAEHGAASRLKNGNWTELVSASDKWKDEIRPIMQMFATRCVGSFLEEKP